MDTYFGNHGLDEVMAKAKLWISGHTHCAFDTSAFGCRWICNAMGHAIEDTGADQNGIVVEL